MTIHVGLIGGGNITETHARAARAIAGVEIAAIYGTNATKVVGLCLGHGGKPYQDFDAFLAHRPLDMVAIGSPSGLHAAQGIAAVPIRSTCSASVFLPLLQQKRDARAYIHPHPHESSVMMPRISQYHFARGGHDLHTT